MEYEMGRPVKSLEDRFWAKINRAGENDCWLWVACTDRDGYGFIWVNEKQRCISASRVAWKIAHKTWPSKSVLHKCDNPPCVNPNHLFLGTAADNNKDRAKKGRSAKNIVHFNGSTNGNAKLSESNVIAIRKAYANGLRKQSEIAKKYGVSQVLISSIVLKKIWRHV